MNTTGNLGRLASLGTLVSLVSLAGCGRTDPAAGGARPPETRVPADGESGRAAAPRTSTQTDRPRSAPRDLAIGDPAPTFEARAHNGQEVTLASLAGKVVVLYFYPKDGTPGCTVEAQQFASQHANLEDAGAVIVGVSSDDNESHRQFAQEHALPFVLLADEDRTIAKAYGVGGFLGLNRRVTYLIDRDGKIAKIYPSVSPKEHAREILADVRALSSGD